MDHIGEVIRRRISTRLDDLGLTAITAAQTAKLPRDTIRNLFRGDGAVPRADTLAEIARALDCSVSYLVGEAPFPSDEQAAREGDPTSRAIPVVFDLEWGRFTALADIPTGRSIPVAVAGYENASLFAGRMIDGHANLYHKVGSYLIFAPFVQGGILPGDQVLVRRDRAGESEFTVRQLDVNKKRHPVLIPLRIGSKYKDMRTVRYGTPFDDFSIRGVVVASFWILDRGDGGVEGFYPTTMMTDDEDAQNQKYRALSADPLDDIAVELGVSKPTI